MAVSLDRMADRVVEVRDGAVSAHEGGYSDWQRATSSHDVER
jgi:ATPase subunit of ABC transporter with duplicated ATPase domains